MSQMKNVTRSKKKSGAASPQVGVQTHRYGKSAGQNNLKPYKGIEKGKK